MASSTVNRIHVIVVAAGVGRRFNQNNSTAQADSAPKQYQLIGDSSVLEHSIKAFDGVDVTDVTVVIHPDDNHWQQQPNINSKHPIHTAIGGLQRHDSVRNGIKSLQANPQDWVLVHDADDPVSVRMRFKL